MHVNRGTEDVEPDSMVDAVLSASRVLVAVAARSLADAGEDVTLTQYRSLVVLASRGPQTVAELADLVAVTPPTASRLCDRLVKKGLIRRRAGRHDRRQVHIALTGDGPRAHRRCHRPSPPRDRGSLGGDSARDPALGGGRAHTAGRDRRRGARTGLERRLGPVSAPERDASSQPRRVGPGAQRPRGALGGSASYLKKWSVLGVVIGAVAGLGAIVFYEALVVCTHFFLNVCAGYQVPTPAGEGGLAASTSAARPWALPLIAGVRCAARRDLGLSHRSGGAGTRHRRRHLGGAPQPPWRPFPRRHRQDRRVGPDHRLGWLGWAGGPDRADQRRFGSLLARILDLEPADGRIAVATGIGSGIGAIFGAPLGGAVLASEILYRDDFDPAALLPSFIASVVSFVVFGAVEGFSPLFGYVGSYRFTDPVQLLWFALIGLLAGLIGLLYAKGFYGLADLFKRSPLPRWAAPAVGGLMVGAIAIAIPQVIGTGYGWVQQCLSHNGLESIPLWIVLIVPFVRILATGLSIGSGGSGGIFGPGIVIGAFLGAARLEGLRPGVSLDGTRPRPLRDRRHDELFRRHLTGTVGRHADGGRDDRELVHHHAGHDRRRHLMVDRAPQRRHHVPQPAEEPIRCAIPTASRRAAAPGRHTRHPRHGRAEIGPQRQSEQRQRPARPRPGRASAAPPWSTTPGDSKGPSLDRSSRNPATTSSGWGTSWTRGLHRFSISRLDVALESLTAAPQSWVPVLDDERRVVGILSVSDVVRAYRQELVTSAERVSDLGATSGAAQVTVTADSPVAGRTLRSAELPPGLLVTSISRGDTVFFPTGDATLEVGDHLTVIGQGSELSRIGRSESLGSPTD